MNPIVRPVTPDGLAGYDKNGQFYLGYDMYNQGKISFVCSSNIHDVLGETCPLCAKGWEKTVDALLDQHWSRDHSIHVHRTCYERHLGFIEREMWAEAFLKLNLSDVFGSFDRSYMALHKILRTMRQIPNEYRGAWNTPWYEILLEGLPGCPVAKIRFGSRKRVYNIEVRDITSDAMKLLPEQFAGEEYKGCAVTQGMSNGNFYIHAWTKEAAHRYIEKIVYFVKEKGNYIQKEPDAVVST